MRGQTGSNSEMQELEAAAQGGGPQVVRSPWPLGFLSLPLHMTRSPWKITYIPWGGGSHCAPHFPGREGRRRTHKNSRSRDQLGADTTGFPEAVKAGFEGRGVSAQGDAVGGCNIPTTGLSV